MGDPSRNPNRPGGGSEARGGGERDNVREQQYDAYTSIPPPRDPMQDVYNASFSPTGEYDYPGRGQGRGGGRQMWQFEPSSRAFAEPTARVFVPSAPVMPKTPPKAALARNASNVTYISSSKKSTNDSLSEDIAACVALFALGVLSALLVSVFSFILNFCLPSVRGRPTRRNFFNAGCAFGCIAQAYIIYKLVKKIANAVK